ncbi:MAG TPA: cytochrome c [Mycobacterium sp.]|nr:cytochrome c [Mycobacterium sp.]
MAACVAPMFAGWSAAADDAVQSAALQPGAPVDARVVDKGKVLYAHHCSHCHGFNMVNPGTISYDLRQFPHNNKERFVSAVIYGKNGRMPQWGDALSLDEIDQLWAYVLTGGQP